MKRIRIGKDIAMRWTILTDGQPTDLANRKLLIEARAANGRVYELEYTTEKNTAIFTFLGKEQRFTGNYTITLWENRGEEKQNVVDKVSAFSLVRSTDEEDNSADAENNLEVETIDLGTTDFTLMGGENTPVDIFSGTELKMMDGTEYFVVKKGEEIHIITAATMQSFFGNGQGGGSATILDGSVTEDKLSNDVKTKINTAASDAATAKTAANNALTSANNALTSANNALTNAQTANSNAANASKLAADANTAATQAKETANGKQEKLTLEVLNNGNIKIGNLNGQTKEFMPATPSGDPMHYAYEAMGAEYNSGEDVIAKTPWASLVDDAAYNAKWGLNLIPNDEISTKKKTLKYGGVDREVWEIKHPYKDKKIWVVADNASDGTKVWADTLVVKRSGMWHFLGLGDLTNADMRTIMVESSPSITAGAFYHSNSRGIMFNRMLDIPVKALFQLSQAEVVKSNGFRPSKDSAYIFSMSNIEHILSGMELSNFSSFSDNALMLPDTIKTFDFIGINANITLSSPNITMKSIISAINKAGTKDITISLSPSLYERVMGNEEITNALSNKPNVNLAST